MMYTLAAAEKQYDAVQFVKFDTYRILHRRRAVLPAIARLSCLSLSVAQSREPAVIDILPVCLFMFIFWLDKRWFVVSVK